MSGLFGDDTLTLYLKLKEAMKQYVRDAMPGGALNPEVKPQDTLDAAALSLTPVPVVGDVAGLLADGYRYATDPSSRTPLNYGLSALGALPFVPSMAGQIAWHGSPHKFPPVRELLMPDGTKLIQDLTQSTHLPEGAKVIAEHPFGKFDLSKIGTGEGAQAYGHGLYLAESPKVAGGYRDKLAKNEVLLDGGKVKHDFNATDPQSLGLNALTSEPSVEGAARALRDAVADPSLWGRGTAYEADLAKQYSAAADWLEQNAKRLQVDSGSLYKTDIPDEAVARFLDWDKPLSEQAHVMDLINKQEAQRTQSVLDRRLQTLANVGEDAPNAPILKKQIEILREEVANPQSGVGSMTGGEYYNYLRRRDIQPSEQANMFRNAGIPGIRYLDGGSRGAGTGTSNFVVFDPDMIRILERNGVATGAKPWQPGEWEGLFKK